MSSPKSSIRATLTSRLKAFPSLPAVAWEGKTYDPIIGTPYLTPSLIPAAPRAGGCGDDAPNQHTGIYQLMLTYPGNSGLDAVNSACDALVDWFKRGTELDAGIGVLTIQKAWCGPESSSADWIAVPISIRYSLFAAN